MIITRPLLASLCIVTLCVQQFPVAQRPAGGVDEGARAIFLEGLALEVGDGRPVDAAAAARQYEIAANMEAAPAMARLGHLYQTGTGVAHDPAKAFMWISKAAPGDFDAKFQLAILYLEGIGTPVDLAAARSWLARAGHAGHQRAQLLLGILLRDGIGGAPNKYAASQWLEKASYGDKQVAATAQQLHRELERKIQADASRSDLDALIVGAIGIAVLGLIGAATNSDAPASRNYDPDRQRRKAQCESQCWARATGSDWIPGTRAAARR